MKYDSKKAIDFGKVYKVYVFTFPNGKKYIGMTRQKGIRRWRKNGYKSPAMKQAINEFGWDKINRKIVAENLTLKEAGEMEIDLIRKYKTLDRDYGYNTSEGGDTYNIHSDDFLNNLQHRMIGNKYCVGRKISQRHIEAMAKSRTPDVYKKVSAKRKGQAVTENVKHILSEKAKERWNDENNRAKYLASHSDMNGSNNPMFGKKHSEETRQKIREKALGRRASDETKRKQSDASRLKRKVMQIDCKGNVVYVFDSLIDAARSVNLASTNISYCCRHQNRLGRGFYWRYVDETN